MLRLVKPTLGLLWTLLLLAAAGRCSQLVAADPQKVIFDTDIGDDCDDAGCMAMMHALADQGKIEILAVMVSNRTTYAPACTDAINTYFKRPNIPIGTVKNSNSKQNIDHYATYIAQNYPHDTGTADTVPHAMKLYRQILAQQPDNSVTIVTVGPATNVSQLLNSGPDEFSSLTGVELVAKKVKFYSAGGNGKGNLPEGQAGWNYLFDLPSASNELLKFPTNIPMLCCAGGSGMKIFTGSGYDSKPANHIIRKCYEKLLNRTTNLTRNSWDQLRLYYAVVDRSNFDTAAFGDITLTNDILKYFPTPNRNRSYAYVRDLALATRELETLMMHEPGGVQPPPPPPPQPQPGDRKVNFNFQPAGTPRVDNYLADEGNVYGNRGNGFSYGWDLDIRADMRDRNANSDQRYDTFAHMQKLGKREWKVALPNGEYQMKLVMGDSRYADQTSNVYVQGVYFADPDGIDKFDEYTANISVTDGFLRIIPGDNASAGAKLAFLELVRQWPLNINFQPANTPLVPDYFADHGLVYGDRGAGLTYGWDVDISVDMRDRNANSYQRYDTFAHMQKLGNRIWKIALPNGTYKVHVVLGDSRYADQTSNIYVQETYLADGDGVDNFDEYTVTVSVPAGTLSIRPAANSKAGAKICFVEISPAASTATDVAAEETVRDLRVAESGSEAPLDLLITSVRGNVRLDRADDGSCVLSGSIPGQPSFNTHGQNVTVTINGQTQVFVLNRKGIASHGTDRFTLKFRKAKQKNGTTPSTDSAASFTLKLRGPLASSALSLGSEVQPLADTAPFDVHLYMLIDGRPYSSSVTTQCSVTKQAKATFKYTRSE